MPAAVRGSKTVQFPPHGADASSAVCVGTLPPAATKTCTLLFQPGPVSGGGEEKEPQALDLWGAPLSAASQAAF